MERKIMATLLKWKTSKFRKPIILKGVRQVGKTWVLKEFGRLHYQNVAYFNFDEQMELSSFFESTKEIERIVQNLILASGQRIEKGHTLLIFDEIQNCPHALNALKYFYENANDYHVVSAGSLLGITLSKPSSFPVGSVDFMELHPMTFSEFLLANGDQTLTTYLDSLDRIEPIPSAFFNPLCEKLKMYYVSGGMPEPLKLCTQEHDVEAMQSALMNILNAYERDFAKYPDRNIYPKLSVIWKSIPSQLSRENKKFLYKLAKEGARAREYEDALQWLVDANLVYKAFRSTRPGLPIAAHDDVSAFKLYLVDIGLLRRHSLLSPTAFGEGNRLFTEFKGALSENYILQSLRNLFEALPRYWSCDNPRYEVDFLIQYQNDIFPIEVKAGQNTESKSLKKYKEIFGDQVKLRIRFSLDNLKLDGDVLNIPLFLADQCNRLIDMALPLVR